MEYSELKAFIKKLYPVQAIDFTFDDHCIAKVEVNFKDGAKAYGGDIYYDKLKVSIQNMEPIYMPIPWYNQKLTHSEIIDKIKNSDIFIPESELKALRDADVKKNLNRPNHGREDIIKTLSLKTGKSEEEILKRAGLPS